MFCLLYGPKLSQCRCDISWGMFIFTRLMFSINFKPQTLKVYFYVYLSRIYTSIHFLFFQNMGLKETQEFPSPEQFVRNNYGKFTHHTDLLIPNDQTVTNQSQSNKSHRASFQMFKQYKIIDQEKGTARRAMPRRWISWRVWSEVSFRLANAMSSFFIFSASQYIYFTEGSLVSVELICLQYLVQCF